MINISSNQYRFLSLVVSFFIMLPAVYAAADETDPMAVYTEFRSGNSNHSGNGTKSSPYNLFEDALEAVADGGTIYILSGGAFVNDENDGLPLVIDKNITISSEPGSSVRSDLLIRKGGIVLGANVIFKDLTISLCSAYHAVICANGYDLTLDNSSGGKGTRVIHLAGGSLSDISASSLSPASGEHSRIVISGSKTNFGNVYAGSINGSFDKPVDIIVDNVSSTNLGKIYASGAKEGNYNGDNFLDPDNEPDSPIASADMFLSAGNVSIELNDSAIKMIDGRTGGSTNASVMISTTYLYECSIQNVNSITVKKGILAPIVCNEGADINIFEEGTFDVSAINDFKPFNVNNFTGAGGTLILDKDDCLKINGTVSGTADLKISKGAGVNSGVTEYNHLYIDTSTCMGDGVFTFLHPHPMQEDIKLVKEPDGWRTSSKPENSDVIMLTKFEVAEPEIIVKQSEINKYGGKIIKIIAEYTDDTYIQDIGMIPLEYEVIYNGISSGVVNSTELSEYEGYYEGIVYDFNMNFSPIESEIAISNYSESAAAELGEIAQGVYDIVITAPTESGYVSQAVKLTVTDEDSVMPTSTPTPTPTALPIPTGSATPIPVETMTPLPEETVTPLPTETSTPEPTPISGIYYEKKPEILGDTVYYKVINKTLYTKALFIAAVYDSSGEILKDIKLIIIKPGAYSDMPIKLNIESGDTVKTFLWNEMYQPI